MSRRIGLLTFLVVMLAGACATVRTTEPAKIAPTVVSYKTASPTVRMTETPTATSTPIAPKATATPSPEPTRLTPTVTPTPYPIRYDIHVPPAELTGARFVSNTEIAFLQWGDLYLYDLVKQSARLVFGDGDITSAEWSEAQQRFAVAKNGRLLIADKSGTILADLSARLGQASSDFQTAACDLKARKNQSEDETISVLEYIRWVNWFADGARLLFAYDIYDGENLCYSTSWSYNLNTGEFLELDTSRYTRPAWVNEETLIVDHYGGGGSHRFDILDVVDGTEKLSVDTAVSEPEYTLGRIADISAPYTILRIWDIEKGTEILHRKYKEEISVLGGGWSESGKYFALARSDEPFSETTIGRTAMPNLTILDTDSGEAWNVPQPFYNKFRGSWIPGTNELLVVQYPSELTSTIALVNPPEKTVMPIAELDATLYPQYPQSWSSTGRYLLLEETKNAYSGRYLWDRQAKDLPPRLIYEITTDKWLAGLFYFVWSPDDQWLIFIQTEGPLNNFNPSSADITLQALHISSGEHYQITQWVTPPEN